MRCASFVSAGRRVLHLRRVAGGVPGPDTRPWPRKSPSAAPPTALVRWRWLLPGGRHPPAPRHVRAYRDEPWRGIMIGWMRPRA